MSQNLKYLTRSLSAEGLENSKETERRKAISLVKTNASDIGKVSTSRKGIAPG